MPPKTPDKNNNVNITKTALKKLLNMGLNRKWDEVLDELNKGYTETKTGDFAHYHVGLSPGIQSALKNPGFKKIVEYESGITMQYLTYAEVDPIMVLDGNGTLKVNKWLPEQEGLVDIDDSDLKREGFFDLLESLFKTTGFVHGDLKRENIMKFEDRHYFLIDPWSSLHKKTQKEDQLISGSLLAFKLTEVLNFGQLEGDRQKVNGFEFAILTGSHIHELDTDFDPVQLVGIKDEYFKFYEYEDLLNDNFTLSTLEGEYELANISGRDPTFVQKYMGLKWSKKYESLEFDIQPPIGHELEQRLERRIIDFIKAQEKEAIEEVPEIPNRKQKARRTKRSSAGPKKRNGNRPMVRTLQSVIQETQNALREKGGENVKPLPDDASKTTNVDSGKLQRHLGRLKKKLQDPEWQGGTKDALQGEAKNALKLLDKLKCGKNDSSDPWKSFEKEYDEKYRKWPCKFSLRDDVVIHNRTKEIVRKMYNLFAMRHQLQTGKKYFKIIREREAGVLFTGENCGV